MLKIISLIIFTLFSNLNSMLAEKVDHETKNEFESLDWQKPEKIHCSNRVFNKEAIKKIYKLSNRRVAIIFNCFNSEIKIFDIDSKKHLKTLPDCNRIYYLQEIPKDRLISLSENREETYLYVKVWDLKSFKLLKKFIFNSSEKKGMYFFASIVYLNNEKLLVIFPEKAICTIDLESGEYRVSKTNLQYIRDIHNFYGGFIAYKYHPLSILIFDNNFNITHSIPCPNDIDKIKTLNHDQFLALRNKCAFLYNFQNIDKIKQQLCDHINVNDINNIILDYLGKTLEDKYLKNERDLNNFTALSNNIIISHCDCHEHIRLYQINPYKLIKEIDIKKLIYETYGKHYPVYDFIVFEDNTIVLQGWNDIFICRPNTQNQNS